MKELKNMHPVANLFKSNKSYNDFFVSSKKSVEILSEKGKEKPQLLI